MVFGPHLPTASFTSRASACASSGSCSSGGGYGAGARADGSGSSGGAEPKLHLYGLPRAALEKELTLLGLSPSRANDIFRAGTRA
jgi:hypothetical protein